jgi:hypothetical protein
MGDYFIRPQQNSTAWSRKGTIILYYRFWHHIQLRPQLWARAGSGVALTPYGSFGAEDLSGA